MNESKCLRCGQCCHFYINGKLKKCKFLIKLNSGKTLCRVYKTRTGRVIGKRKDGKDVICLPREMQQEIYPGCPYNKANWEENKHGKDN